MSSLMTQPRADFLDFKNLLIKRVLPSLRLQHRQLQILATATRMIISQKQQLELLEQQKVDSLDFKSLLILRVPAYLREQPQPLRQRRRALQMQLDLRGFQDSKVYGGVPTQLHHQQQHRLTRNHLSRIREQLLLREMKTVQTLATNNVKALHLLPRTRMKQWRP